MTDATFRSAPYSEEAERGVLGSILIDSKKVLELCDKAGINDDSFYVPAHRIIYGTIREMKGMVIDPITLGEQLKKLDRLQAVGCSEFVEELFDATPTPAHAEYYIRFVIDKQKRRDAIDISTKTIEQCYDDDQDIELIVDSTKNQMRELGVSLSTERIVTTDDILESADKARKGDVDSAPLPFDKLNRRTGGVPYRMVSILTGRSKSGKSMLKSYWQRKNGEKKVTTLDLCFEDKTRIAKTRCASVSHFNASAFLKGGEYKNVKGVWEWFPTSNDTMRKAREQFDYIDQMPSYWYDAPCTGQNMMSVI